MKILFIHKEEDPIDPMQIELLSAIAKREGHDTFLNILQHKDLSDTLLRVRPDIVAYTGKTGEHRTLFKVNRFIKETLGEKVFTIMGGPHTTFNHRAIQLFGESDTEFQAYRENGKNGHAANGNGSGNGGYRRPLIPEKSELDALCIGEGDDAWAEFLRAIKAKQSIDDIPNIVTRTNRKKYPEPVFRERRVDLDDLPFYDRALVWDKTFLANFPMRSFMTSRGCPFRCTYCFNYDWNKTYREAGKMKKLHNRYSVDRLIAEVQDWLRVESERGYAKTQFIKFYDDMFEFRVSPWLEEFAEKYPKEVGIPFSCLVRCDIFAHEEKDGSVKRREEVLLYLKKAGMRSINMSIEAGNNFIRENILVRDMTEKEIRTAFGMMKKHGIGTFANTILGIPAPVIPKPSASDFDQKLSKCIHETKLAFFVAKQQVEGTKGMKYPAELDPIKEHLDSGTVTEEMRHQAVQILESMDLRHDPIDYDIEGVELTIQSGIHETLFPRLDPYPGTVITDYTVAIGAFDGNFDQLHSSCLSTSSFSCFTKRHKMIQDNLSFLGQVCAVWPWLWPFAKKVLIYLPLTRLYWAAFVLAKSYHVNRHVYPMKFDLKSFVRSAYRILLFEIKQFFHVESEEHFYKKPKGWMAAASPTDQLGGRWES